MRHVIFLCFQSFGNFLEANDFLDIWMVEDPIQMTKTVTCDFFQIYVTIVYLTQMKKLSYKTLTKINLMKNVRESTQKTIETLLNEFFALEKEKNEQLMEQYVKHNDITIQ